MPLLFTMRSIIFLPSWELLTKQISFKNFEFILKWKHIKANKFHNWTQTETQTALKLQKIQIERLTLLCLWRYLIAFSEQIYQNYIRDGCTHLYCFYTASSWNEQKSDENWCTAKQVFNRFLVLKHVGSYVGFQFLIVPVQKNYCCFESSAIGFYWIQSIAGKTTKHSGLYLCMLFPKSHCRICSTENWNNMKKSRIN